MNTSATHIIKRTVLDFQFNGSTDGFSFQQEVRDWFDEFIQQLSSKLDEIAIPDTMISIDELQLEVELTATDWKQQASQKITEQLKDKIQLIQNGVIASSGYKQQTNDEHFANAFLFINFLCFDVNSVIIFSSFVLKSETNIESSFELKK